MAKLNLEKRVGRIELSLKLIASFSLAIAISTLVIVVHYNTLSPQSEEIDIEYIYEGLNKQEIKHIKSIIGNIYPVYFNPIKSIIITKNITKYCDDCAGKYFTKSHKVVIEYVGFNERDLRVITCHEFLHGYLPEEKYHDLVRALAKKEVCYKTINDRISLNLR